jgi:hypothetical protein
MVQRPDGSFLTLQKLRRSPSPLLPRYRHAPGNAGRYRRYRWLTGHAQPFSNLLERVPLSSELEGESIEISASWDRHLRDSAGQRALETGSA